MTDYKKELEEFSYIVSHDLNAPLRHIKAFSSLLKGEAEGKLSDQEQEYLDHIETSVIRAQGLLAALLEYSRLNTHTEDRTDFDITAAIQKAISRLEDRIQTQGADISIDVEPKTVTAVEPQIVRVFEALIDNALKFQESGATPVIKILSFQADGHDAYAVVDNGIGIPENQHENVFRMFKCLTPKDYEGIGSGLAIAKKIIDDHGGAIWFEPSDGGAHVCLML